MSTIRSNEHGHVKDLSWNIDTDRVDPNEAYEGRVDLDQWMPGQNDALRAEGRLDETENGTNPAPYDNDTTGQPMQRRASDPVKDRQDRLENENAEGTRSDRDRMSGPTHGTDNPASHDLRHPKIPNDPTGEHIGDNRDDLGDRKA
jgi:hypothetical protein